MSSEGLLMAAVSYQAGPTITALAAVMDLDAEFSLAETDSIIDLRDPFWATLDLPPSLN